VLKGCMSGARFEVVGISAVAGEQQGCVVKDLWKEAYPEMYKCALEGMPAEELAWAMNLEEPTAASCISKAINNKNRVAMLPTEMECISVCALEIDLAVADRHSRDVRFQSCKEKLRTQLDILVDEPDFIQVFKFVLELGAGQDGFIKYLKSWYSTYVNPQMRKMKLDNYKQASQFNTEEPWLKIAHIIWAYRQKARTDSWCPTLSTSQVCMPVDVRKPMNDMLNFWHGPLKQHMSFCGMSENDVMKWTANADHEVVNAVYKGLTQRPARCKDAASVEAEISAALGPLWDGLVRLVRPMGRNKPHYTGIPAPPFAIALPSAPPGAKGGGKPGTSASAVAEPEIRARVPELIQNADTGSYEVMNEQEEIHRGPRSIVRYRASEPAAWIGKPLVRNSCNEKYDVDFIDATVVALHKDLPHEDYMQTLTCVGTRDSDKPKEPTRSDTKEIEANAPIKAGELVLWAIPGHPTYGLKPYDEAAVAAIPKTAWARYAVTERGASERVSEYMLSNQWQELAHDPTVVGSRKYDGAEKMHLYWKVRRVTPQMIEDNKKNCFRNKVLPRRSFR